MADDKRGDDVKPALAREERREELERLFAEWDSKKPEEDPEGGAGDDDLDPEIAEALAATGPRRGVNMLRLRLTLTALLTFLAGYLMWFTYADFAYFISGQDAPTDIGNLKKRWAGGERQLDVATNTWVKVDGMFTTLESVSGDEEQLAKDQAEAHFFLCPLYNIVVRTEQPFIDKNAIRVRQSMSLSIDPVFAPLLINKRAFPEDLAQTFSGQGRLVRASEAPKWARSGAKFYVVRLGVDPDDLWMLLDGDTPEDHVLVAVLWGVAPLVPLTSLFLLWRAWRRRRK